ncbi:hypothetical protein SY83_07140 [Paenibacillus swuensis]|uniref:Methyltransferase domain-containing protein n=1 Tax=Paenibacillus swuensis TaxID=1178515 RepID=A0A172TGR5_9BACL|nr:methyltransferase domain-containing protein [Paenibacillus swuensis]ANE46094.1 hypothetical protein SY83_07140 [Paenibacillus swuensis]
MSADFTEGERLYAATFEEALRISKDHAERYRFATRFIGPSGGVLDAACGSGYGSYYMGVHTQAEFIASVDRSEDALNWARQHFAKEHIYYIQADFAGEFESIVGIHRYQTITCFETVEHIEDDVAFVRILSRLLRPSGKLLISAPNEDVVPHQNNPWYPGGVNPYHYRHYRPAELERLVMRSGLRVLEHYTQLPEGTVIKGSGGPIILLVCEK